MYHHPMRTGIAWSCPRLRLLVLAAALAACGGDDDDRGVDCSVAGSDGAGAADAAAADAQPPFDATTTLLVLTSSAFEYGEEIPLRHACVMHGGEDLVSSAGLERRARGVPGESTCTSSRSSGSRPTRSRA
jgi:hypothetical protein